MNVAELVGRTLAGLGAGTAFGVVGSGNFEVTNALRAGGVRFVAARHEGGAASMADAYARMSGQVSVLSLHQGCGLTNAVTGITEAAKSRTPMLVLTADSAAASVLSNFRIDQDGLAAAVGAVPERVHSAATAVADTARAFRTARQQRRTVVLNLPLDVQSQPAPSPLPLPDIPGPALVRPDTAAVAALTNLLAAAERPVFIAGRGARGSGDVLRELAARCGALLATSAVAHGLFLDDPFALGISGGFASPAAAELIVGADLVVGWGCALNMWTTRHGKLLSPHARLVQVDVEQAALGAHRPIDLGVVGDVAATALDVLALTQEHRGYRTAEVAARIAAGRWNDVEHEDLSGDGRIDPRTLSRLLDELLPAERIVSIDSGNFMGYPSAYLSVPDEHGFCFTQAFQSIGLGLGTAIGAALARPDRLPVLGTGDGGFHMALSELDTAVRLELPLVVIVYNDAAYGAEIHHFGDADMTTVRFPDSDLAAIARGFGCTGVTVRSAEDLPAVREWLTEPRSAPLVIDAKIADDGGSWWLAEAFRH
ncbi:acetolactate synthase I/II/III large subunit [Amycolatopsis mediterranei S699]|uniref:Acetolactate synthase I/II/III large subunit n=3 Tax=Amycolatopsis mediterranei TaxID=33910 RepID=A0A0H3D9B3_AMYMU|nr:thiamine pyrophosphate-binding protein [Amycolatopsis mediterranei]ADJ47600.1 acetolactate synthase I/II/III large subunit [Amycolatopsis mediterranei U32]AEK44483.1 acetolactate synthase I/II/III large subunit [Amycolatopsis mediterranei S699]AFO79311.1 acetolactate synthase I/II/III large subunit [Amycolatopsis mediterranei S699]AGT86439.1 acetolactate synthase I/II/III large subunit [Amycolatopsis mediterranei RB]KDO11230.1 acetolactate synthase [Amycolatopsis mediterranei]